MADKAQVEKDVLQAFEREPRFGPEDEVRVNFEDGTLTIEGEVKNVAVKKLLLEQAAAHPAVSGIVDRLHVAPAQRLDDAQTRAQVHDALLEEPALSEAVIREQLNGETATVRDPPGEKHGWILIRVRDGVVTLDGELPSLSHKRLAGVLAWWAPGSRDVINGIECSPPMDDSDEEITDAVRMALEKDPFVNASQIHVVAHDAVVSLEGLVPTESERDMAELDAWYVFGVDKVINYIKVYRSI